MNHLVRMKYKIVGQDCVHKTWILTCCVFHVMFRNSHKGFVSNSCKKQLDIITCIPYYIIWRQWILVQCIKPFFWQTQGEVEVLRKKKVGYTHVSKVKDLILPLTYKLKEIIFFWPILYFLFLKFHFIWNKSVT